MQSCSAPKRAQLLADVQLGTCAPSTAAWCPVNGMLAVGARLQPNMACVYLMSPHCLEHKVTLAVPLQGPEDDLVCVAWSPLGCRRVLLTATRSGAVSAWSQHTLAHGAQQADGQPFPILTLGDWWCHRVGQLIPSEPAAAPTAGDGAQPPQEHLLSLQWLQPPSQWPYSNSALQEQDFQAGSVPNMFAPAAHSRRAASGASRLEQAASNLDGSAEMERDLFHWVQPGTLAFAAVLSSGQAVVGWATWAVQGQLKWQLTPRLELAAAAAGGGGVGGGGESTATEVPGSTPLLAADVSLSVDGVVVAFATQQEPDKVQVAELQGNPSHHQCLSAALRAQRAALRVSHLAATSITAGAPCSIRSLSWDPHSNGQRLVAATSSVSTASTPHNSSSNGPGHVTLLSLTEQPQQPNQPQAYVLAPGCSAQVATAPGPQQYAWLLEGLLVGEQLLDAHSLVQCQLDFPRPGAAPAFLSNLHSRVTGSNTSHPGTVLRALASSPHRVAVAAVLFGTAASTSGSNGSSSRPSSHLVLYSIPPVSAAAAEGTMAPILAGRLVWSLLLQLHRWDLVQHVLHTAHTHQQAGGLGVVQRVTAVLSLVDRKLSAQPDKLCSTYALRWDGLKYALVCSTPGGEARAFSIDMRLRQLVPVLDIHLAAAGREEDQRQAASQQQQQSHRGQQPGNSGAAAIVEYLGTLLEFEVACVNTWLHRRKAAAAAAASDDARAAAATAVAAVPCIRHLLDFRTSTKLAAVYSRAVDLSKLARVSRSWSLWKQLNKATDGTTEPPQNWEDMLLDVVPGPFELHPQHPARAFPPCLLNFRLPAEQLLQHLQSLPDWQQVPVLSDADITSKATRLGLLPVKTQQATEEFHRQLHEHSGFRQQLPFDQLGPPVLPAAGLVQASTAACSAGTAPGKRVGDASLLAAKRQRWEQQLRDAMGSTVGPVAVCSAEVVDFVHMSWGSPAGMSLQGVDGSVVVQQAAHAAADGRPPHKLSASVSNNWAYACPMTGEMWLHVTASPAAERVL